MKYEAPPNEIDIDWFYRRMKHESLTNWSATLRDEWTAMNETHGKQINKSNKRNEREKLL